MIVLARIISLVFEPMIVMALIALTGGWRSGLRGEAYAWYSIAMFVLTFFVACVRLLLVRKFKTNWDISDRHKRVRLLIILFGFVGILFWSMTFWKNSALTNLFGLFLLWLLGFFLITLKYKISGHVAMVTLAAGLFFQWFGFWQAFFLVPLVAWARVVGKNHTIGEVITGALYSLFLLVVFDYWII